VEKKASVPQLSMIKILNNASFNLDDKTGKSYTEIITQHKKDSNLHNLKSVERQNK
jgi:hypothetical protein